MASCKVLLENTIKIESGSSALMPLAYPSGTQTTLLSKAERRNTSGFKHSEGFSQSSIFTKAKVNEPFTA